MPRPGAAARGFGGRRLCGLPQVLGVLHYIVESYHGRGQRGEVPEAKLRSRLMLLWLGLRWQQCPGRV